MVGLVLMLHLIMVVAVVVELQLLVLLAHQLKVVMEEQVALHLFQAHL
jgi:hypothetical protein